MNGVSTLCPSIFTNPENLFLPLNPFPMHKKPFLFALLGLLVCRMASAQVALTVDMNSVVNPARAE